MLVDALLIGLPDGNNGIPGEIFELRKHFLGHLSDTIFNKPGVFVRGKEARNGLSGTVSEVIPW